MAYYQGDYYQGDYYQGDPFLGSLFAKGIGWLGKKIFKRKLNPAGVTELTKRINVGNRRYLAPVAGAALLTAGQIPIPFSPFQMNPRAILPGGQPFISQRDNRMLNPPQMAQAGCCPSGYHMAKDGSQRCVRNRSMNVANPRALRRSLRRVAGFGKLAQRSKKDIRRAAKAIGA